MNVKLANKLNDISCEYLLQLKEKLNVENYGIKSCYLDNMSDLDKNPEYLKLKKDVLNYYKDFTETALTNDNCNVLNIIKRF